MLSRISIIIPAYNEENSIGLVLNALPRQIIHEIIVVDNGSTDETACVAIENGARVVKEPKKGYGAACLKGIERLDSPDIVVFLDGDFSDFPEEIVSLIDPIEKEDKDFVIGSRMILPKSQAALLPQARFGNQLSKKDERVTQFFLFPKLFFFTACIFHVENQTTEPTLER